MQAIQKGAINLVNPKLSAYDKPFMLAIAIGLLTAGGTLTLAVYMSNESEFEETVMTLGSFDDHWRQFKQTQESFPDLCVDVAFDYMIVSDFNTLQIQECLPWECSNPGDGCWHEFKEVICKEYETKPGWDGKEYEIANYPDWQGNRSFVSSCSFTELTGMRFKKSFKQSIFTTIGAALGFAGYIEVLVSIFIIGLLSLVRLIHLIKPEWGALTVMMDEYSESSNGATKMSMQIAAIKKALDNAHINVDFDQVERELAKESAKGIVQQTKDIAAESALTSSV